MSCDSSGMRVALQTPNLRISRTPVSDAYTFGPAGEYEIRIAASIEDRRRAWALVHDAYVRKGYARPNAEGLRYGIHDALPDTTTFLAEHDGEAVAALTVVCDGPLGLPADEVSGPELDMLRGKGRYPCEIVSLVDTERRRSRGAMIVMHMFKLAFVTARHVEEATDFVITVNPRHVPYYERVLLFEEIGEEKEYEKVCGAPAVLLGLDLLDAETRYRGRFGGLPEEKNLYRFFTGDMGRWQGWIRRQRRPLDGAEIRRYFTEKELFLVCAGSARKRRVEGSHSAYSPVPVAKEA